MTIRSKPILFSRAAFACGIVLVFLAGCATSKVPDEYVTGLQQVEKTTFDHAYLKSGIDFSKYKSIVIEDSTVAFRKNWEHDQRLRFGAPLTRKDIERIKSDNTRLMREALTRRLQEDGYSVVETASPNTLRLKPAIVDLDIYSPDLDLDHNKNFIFSAGAGRVIFELYDAASGDKVGYLADYKDAQYHSSPVRTSRIYNNVQMKTLYSIWARKLTTQLAGGMVNVADNNSADRDFVAPAPIE